MRKPMSQAYADARYWSDVNSPAEFEYWRAQFDVRELRSRVIEDDGESAATRKTFKVARHVARKDLEAWLWDHYHTWCQHSYDCCGGWYGSPLLSTLRHTKGREWTVVIGYHRNI